MVMLLENGARESQGGIKQVKEASVEGDKYPQERKEDITVGIWGRMKRLQIQGYA